MRILKLLAPCLLLTPFVVRAENSPAFGVHLKTFEKISFSEYDVILAPENLSSFSVKTSAECEEPKIFSLRATDSRLVNSEPLLMASEARTLQRQTITCGRNRRVSQPVPLWLRCQCLYAG
jgi:hypothetical protein